MALNVGSSSVVASHAHTDISNRVLIFLYTVDSVDSDQNGVSIAANSIVLNGGAIKEQASDLDANLDHPDLSDQEIHRVNKVPMIVPQGIAVASTPFATSDTYGSGETIVFTVTFDAEVVLDTANSLPQLRVRVGDPGHPARNAVFNYVLGSGNRTLEFESFVRPSDWDNNGLNVLENQLRLNGGTIRHATTGKDANLNHPKPGNGREFPVVRHR